MDANRLRNLPLFEQVAEDDVKAIAPFVSEVSVSEGKPLVTEGDYSYELMMIEEGTAEVTRGGEKLAELGAGDYFGEMGLVADERRNATVIATSPMRLFTLDRWDMKRLEKQAPDAAAKIRETIQRRQSA